MLDGLTPDQILAAVMPALVANYREWTFQVQCGRCLASVAHVSPHTLTAIDPAMSVQEAVARLRCHRREYGSDRCRGAPGYFAMQANDRSIRIVLISAGRPAPRIERPEAP